MSDDDEVVIEPDHEDFDAEATESEEEFDVLKPVEDDMDFTAPDKWGVSELLACASRFRVDS
jgi:hypothetical protein